MREIEPARKRNIYEVTPANKPTHRMPRDLSRRAHEAEVELRVEDGRTDLRLRRLSAYFTYSVLALNTTVTLVILFLCGFRLMTLSTAVQLSLIAETLGIFSTVFITMNRYLFPRR
jgi:hypothetical protein